MRRIPKGMPENFGPEKAFRESFHYYTIKGDTTGDDVKVEYTNRKWNCLKCNSDCCSHAKCAQKNFEAGAKAAGTSTKTKAVWSPENKAQADLGTATPKGDKAKV